MRLRSLSCGLVLALLGCESLGGQVAPRSLPEPGYGIALIGVDSDRPIDKLDLCSNRGCVDAGSFSGVRDIHTVQLLPDEYCVTRLTGPAWAGAGVGIIELDEDRLCFTVGAGMRSYVGHVTLIYAPSQTASTGVKINLVRRSDVDGVPRAHSRNPDGRTRLSPDELEIGVSRLAGPIRKCAVESGLGFGARIHVEFTIDGPSGAVVEAHVADEGASAALRGCIREVVRAQGPGVFPVSQAEQQRFGYEFSVR